ncbi:hypothetical protein Nmel_015484 [Mimus melanotis]
MFFPAGVSSPQVTESACTGCVRLCAAAQRLSKRISCHSFLSAPQERRRGRFLTQLLPCRQPLFARPAARGPCGAALPPPRLSGCLFTHPGPARAVPPRPIGRPAPRPGDVTGGGTGPLPAQPGALRGSGRPREEGGDRRAPLLRPGQPLGAALAVTVSLLSFVWKVPHTLQNNNGFCLHIPVFLLSASSAKL